MQVANVSLLHNGEKQRGFTCDAGVNRRRFLGCYNVIVGHF